MRWIAWLRGAFSRYELAAMGHLVQLSLFTAIVIAAFRGAHWLVSVIGMALVATGIVTWIASACPECGKPPMLLRLGLRNRELNEIFGIWRWWPERICSDCGARLDVL